jgi:hypothetical protein
LEAGIAACHAVLETNQAIEGEFLDTTMIFSCRTFAGDCLEQSRSDFMLYGPDAAIEELEPNRILL